MGIKGFSKIIDNHPDEVCTVPTSLRGKLLVDGHSILHELYDKYHLEWASGGFYADQHKATLDFYGALISSGIEPVVVLNGTSTKTHIQDTIERRNKDINSIPGELRKLYENSDSQDYRDHFLPLLSRHVYKSSLKSMGIPVFVADGKSYEMVVRLASHYGCPVLTNNTNYCVSNLSGGVVFIHHFDKPTCSAPVYKQKKMVEFLKLPNPDLIFALVAILGDGCDTSVSFIYHGPVERDIQFNCRQAKSDDRPWVFNIVDYFKIKGIRSFHDLQSNVESLRFGKLKPKLSENCRTINENFIHPPPPVGVEDLIENAATRYTSEHVIPEQIVAMHRLGNYPDNVVSAMCEGKCILDVYVGDPDQSPISKIGIPIRQVMYGLVRSKMEKSYRIRIEEYYRSDVSNSSGKPWEYSCHQIKPIADSIVDYVDLSAENIFSLDIQKLKTKAKQVIFSLLSSSPELVQELRGETGSEYLLAVLTTQYWVKSIKHILHPDRLIRSLILNFFICPDKEGNPLDLYSDPQWIKVYHALLEWQALYRDMCSLNTMLLSPFEELHPTHLLHSTFVIRMAMNPNSDDITTFRERMSLEKQHLYDNIVTQLVK